MNILTNGTPDDLKAFRLLAEVADDQPVSQRELAQRLGIALGLVNSYLKNFVARGYIRIRNYPRNRYSYLLTPAGMAEKARLAYQHVNYFTSLYTVTRQEYLELFRGLAARGIREIAFCGLDEVTEIAWLSLQEAGLELTAVLDDIRAGETFMGRPVAEIAAANIIPARHVVITSLKRCEPLLQHLLQQGVDSRQVVTPGSCAAAGGRNMEESHG